MWIESASGDVVNLGNASAVVARKVGMEFVVDAFFGASAFKLASFATGPEAKDFVCKITEELISGRQFYSYLDYRGSV